MLDSSEAVSKEIAAATSMHILNGLWARSLGDEVRMMDPVGSVAHGRPGQLLLVDDSRWHERQWVGTTWIPVVAPRVRMDAMTGAEVVEVAGG